jgi:CheY-specific phosphatase CheX
MFFMTVEDVEAAPAGGDGSRAPARETSLVSEITFHGAHVGRLRVVVPESCASELAANFTGTPDPGQLDFEQVAEVLRELTNMMCGTTLSRLAPLAVFDLDPPVLLAPDAAHPGAGPLEPELQALALRLKSGGEWMDLYWRWQEAV